MAAFSWNLSKRYQNPMFPNNYNFGTVGTIIKYCVGIGLVVIILLWVVGGYFHARRRLSAGKQPLWYHRWLVARHSDAPMAQSSAGYGVGQYGPTPYELRNGVVRGSVWRRQEEEGIELPPAYSHDIPPAYQPASKIDPNQDIADIPVGEASRSSNSASEDMRTQTEAPTETHTDAHTDPPTQAGTEEPDLQRPVRIYTLGGMPMLRRDDP